jgi:hypothetical protein
MTVQEFRDVMNSVRGEAGLYVHIHNSILASAKIPTRWEKPIEIDITGWSREHVDAQATRLRTGGWQVQVEHDIGFMTLCLPQTVKP